MIIKNKSLVELKSLKAHLEFEVGRKIFAQKQIDKLDTNFDDNIDKKELLRMRLDTMIRMDLINYSDFEGICELAKCNRIKEEYKLQEELAHTHWAIYDKLNE